MEILSATQTDGGDPCHSRADRTRQGAVPCGRPTLCDHGPTGLYSVANSRHIAVRKDKIIAGLASMFKDVVLKIVSHYEKSFPITSLFLRSGAAPRVAAVEKMAAGGMPATSYL